MTGKISKQHQATFDGIRHLDDDGNEYWLARELAPVREYPQWRNFLPLLERARQACRQGGQAVSDHFAGIRKMVEIGSGERPVVKRRTMGREIDTRQYRQATFPDRHAGATSRAHPAVLAQYAQRGEGLDDFLKGLMT